jgi:ABC-2 type transport system permease protein
MNRFFAAVLKELLLLKQDRSGLLVLFVMPAVLVLVITLVQENAMKAMGERQTDVLFLDEDGGLVGRRIEKMLSTADGVHLSITVDGFHPSRSAAVAAVAAGKFQLCVIVPAGMTAAVQNSARLAAEKSLALESVGDGKLTTVSEIAVYFDPTVMGGFRSAVTHLLKLMILSIEVEEKVSALSGLLPKKLQRELNIALGPMAGLSGADLDPKVKLTWNSDPLLTIHTESAQRNEVVLPPNAVQQNVPAWALFGVFFIVLPMAGSFIRERLQGIRYRMLAMPVSIPTLLAGKLFAYLLVTIIQFGLILCIGRWILPLFGTPAFTLGGSALAAGIVALAVILAATGYGILLGTLSGSYEQAAMFGALSIVIAAAIGGIMVPVFAMPRFMQQLSFLSPLGWGQNAFLEIFVRGGDLKSVLFPVSGLILFSLGCTGSAWALSGRKNR